MAVIEGGTSAALAGVGAESAKGLHTIGKPQDYATLGHYSAVLETGAIAAGMAALGEIMQFRWIDSTRFAVIHEVQILEFFNTTAFTAGRFLFGLWGSTAWSADGTGGANPTVTDPQLQLRPAVMGPTLLSTGFRIATTAALGAGTKTLNTLAFGATYGRVGAIGTKHFIPPSPVVTTAEVASGAGSVLFKTDTASGEHPIVLGQNEGVSVRATVPATGVWTASILIKWAEVTAF